MDVPLSVLVPPLDTDTPSEGLDSARRRSGDRCLPCVDLPVLPATRNAVVVAVVLAVNARLLAFPVPGPPGKVLR